MDCHCTHIPYHETGYFSRIVTDYLEGASNLDGFYQYNPDEKGIKQAIEDRKHFPVDRAKLVDALTTQYKGLEITAAVAENLSKLKNENTFTICTAHQPNLATGYLYFIYKIAHTISLARELNRRYPDNYFVPVFYMGSEDNDIEELGTFRYAGKKFVWDGGGQNGAVGRMKTASLKPLLKELFSLLGPPGVFTDELKDLLHEAYEKHSTVGAATQYLVNRLFGEYGLIVLDPDNAVFKSSIAHIMLDDLEHGIPGKTVTATISGLSQHYHSQAFPRSINLFYLSDGLRERIEKKDDKWVVLHTALSFTRDELLTEVNTHPERFSPNVILRGILQESILPNVAFIGGGAEVAYWLQLKELFDHYKIFYPAVLLRQSVLWVTEQADLLRQKTGIPVYGLFKPVQQLQQEWVDAHGAGVWDNAADKEEARRLLQKVRERAVSIDATLRHSADAVLTKILYQLEVLEKKMLRAEKRKYAVEMARIEKLHHLLFPNGALQERVENLMEYYPRYGHGFIDTLIANISPLKSEILVINTGNTINK